MKKFTDQSGWLRVLVCCLALVVHHGLRDALIPALPTIAASTDMESSTTESFSTTESSSTPDGISSDFTDESVSPTSPSSGSNSVTTSLSLDLGSTTKGPSEAATVTENPIGSHTTRGASTTSVGSSESVPTLGELSNDPPTDTPAESSSANLLGSPSESSRTNTDAERTTTPSTPLDPKPENHVIRPSRSLAALDGPQNPLTPTRSSSSNVLETDSNSVSEHSEGDGARVEVLEGTGKESSGTSVKVTYSLAHGDTEDLPGRISGGILAGRLQGKDLGGRISKENLAERTGDEDLGGRTQLAEDHPTDEITGENQVEGISPDDLARQMKTFFRQVFMHGVFDKKQEEPERVDRKTKENFSTENPFSGLIKSLDFSSVWMKLSGDRGRRPSERRTVWLQESIFHDEKGRRHEVREWEYEVEDYGEEYHLPELKEGWTLVMEGAVLSAIYWAWLLTVAFADKIVDKLGVGTVMALSVGLTGIFGLVTHAASLGGPWALLALRVGQGAAQGLSFPAILRVMEYVPEQLRNLASLVVFMGPYLGTCLGVGLGSLEEWYIVMYVLGALALCLVIPCVMLPSNEANKHEKLAWRRVLQSRAVWACLGVHIANTWVLHTLLVGVPFCLTYFLDQPDISGWSTLLVVAAVAVVSRPLVFFSRRGAEKGALSVLDRRRAPVLAGTLLVVTALILLSTLGLDIAGVFVGVAVGCAGVGIGLIRVGNRLNIEDLAPLQLWRVVHVFNIVGALVAAVTPLVVTGLAEVGKSGWIAVWLAPLVLVVPAALIHLFCLSANAQSFDQHVTGYDGPGAPPRPVRVSTISVGGLEGIIANGHGPPKEQRRSIRSRQSFKSAQSALTFKTAMSRPRALSCRTIDDDLEADLKSVVEEASIDCRSIALESEMECRSVASTTYKSDYDDMFSALEGYTGDIPQRRDSREQPHALYNGTSLDRTTAWLSYHYAVGTLQRANSVQQPSKEEIKRKNSVFALAW